VNFPSEGQSKCLDALFFISVYSHLKCCPSGLDISGVRDFPLNFRNSSPLTATFKNSQSSRYVSAANHVYEEVAILRKPIASLKQILYKYVPFLYQIIFVFSGLMAFCYCFSYRIVFVLFAYSYVSMYLYCFVFYLCLCADFITGTCAAKPAG